MRTRIRFKYLFLIVAFFLMLTTSFTRNSLYAVVAFSILAYVIVPFQLDWNKDVVLLLLFSIFYSLIKILNNDVGSLFNLIAYIISPVIFFRLGYMFMNLFWTDKARELFFLFIIVFFLSPIIYQTIEDIRIVGIVNPTRHLLNEIADSGMMSATLYGLMASVGIGGISALFVKCSKITIKLGYIIVSLLSVLIAVHLVNRSGLVILLVCMIVAYMLSVNRINLHRIPIALAAILFMIIITLNSGLISDDIISAYQYRAENSADSKSAGGRTELWYYSLSHLLTSPFGWESDFYSHNMLLDIARVSGLFAFIPFLSLTILYINRIIRLIKRKRRSAYIIIFVSMNLSMFLAAMVEPVIDASILFFSLLMMIWGCAFKLSKEIE